MIIDAGHWTAESLIFEPASWQEAFDAVLRSIWHTKLVRISHKRLGHFDEAVVHDRYDRLCQEIFDHLGPSSRPRRAWGDHPRERWIDVTSAGKSREQGKRRPVHTDEAGQPAPADICLMYCISPAAQGGVNEYLSVTRLWSLLVRHDERLAWRALSQALVFSQSGATVRVPLVRRSRRDLLLHFNDTPQPDASGNELKHAFEAFLESIPSFEWIEAPLGPGDAVIWWDSQFLHRRSPETGPGERHFRKVGIAGCGRPSASKPLHRPGQSPVTPSQAKLLDHIVEAAQSIEAARGRSNLVIGIDGISASGKSTLAWLLAQRIRSHHGRAAQVVNLDDFHRPRARRYADATRSRAFSHLYFDFGRLQSRLLQPFRSDGSVDRDLTLLDFDRDSYTRVASFRFPPGSVVIVEGVFLLREPFVSSLDYSVYLDVRPDVSYARVMARKLGKEPFTLTSAKFFDRYLLAFMAYQRTHMPWFRADLIVDNNDLEKPVDIRKPELASRWPL